MRRRRRGVLLRTSALALPALLAAAVSALLALSPPSGHSPETQARRGVLVTTTRRAMPAAQTCGATGTSASADPPGASEKAPSTVAASQVSQLQVFRSPDSQAPWTVLGNPTSLGVPLVLLATHESGQWVEVDLPVKPNGTQGWVRSGDVSLSSDPYRVLVQLDQHELSVYDGSSLALIAPIGIGSCATPTPLGGFFLDALLKPPQPGGPYGDYAYGTSAFSESLAAFDGGPAVIGIHGTNDPSSIGKSESNGCIRMYNQDIDKLAPLLPLGTPVEIMK